MKHYFRVALTSAALLPLCVLRAQAVPLKPDAVMNQMITQQLDTATMDDYLINMARAVNVNVFADATDFPPASPVAPYPATSGAIAGVNREDWKNWSSTLISVMGDFVAQEKLSTLRSGERTFLFWSEPDPRELLDLQLALSQADDNARFANAVAAAKANGLLEEQPIHGALPEDQLKRVLFDTLQTQRGWTPTYAQSKKKVDIRIPFADLSPDLRALILSDLRQNAAGSNELQFLQDDLWKKDDLRVLVWKENGSSVIGLQLRQLDEDGQLKSVTPSLLTKLDVADTAPTAIDSLPPQTAKNSAVQLAPAFDQSTMDKVYGGILDDGSNPLLDNDPTLQKATSIEAKRLALREFLARLQEQSGVSFGLAEHAPADKLITLRVDAMPLARIMENLSRIYGVKWSKNETGYTMQGDDRGELHLKLLQMGDPARYRFRFLFYNRAEREQEKAAIGRAVIEKAGLAALQTPQGVEFSTLPSSLQEQWRRVVEAPIEENCSVRLYRLNALLTEQLAQNGLVLRFGNAVEQTPIPGLPSSSASSELLSFSILSQDGKMAEPIFTSAVLLYGKQAPGHVRTPGKPPSRRR